MIITRFMLVGVANTVVGLAVIYLAMYAFGLGVVAANALGYGVGLALGFTLNKRWTFVDRGRLLPSLLRYLLVVGVAYGVNLAIVHALVSLPGVNAYVAQAAGIAPYTLIAYLGCRYYAFRETSPLRAAALDAAGTAGPQGSAP